MKWIKGFKKYKESLHIDLTFDQIDLMESLNIWHDVLLTSISAEKVDLLSIIKLPDEFKDKLDLDTLSENNEFIENITSIGLKKSPIQNSKDFQTFVNKPFRFMFLYDFNSNELENPKYILFQTRIETSNKWEETKLFKVKDDMKPGSFHKIFNDKLTSRTIEIVDGEENYIYSTSNGNDWELQNSDKSNDIYKKTFRKEELQKILDDNKVTLNII